MTEAFSRKTEVDSPGTTRELSLWITHLERRPSASNENKSLKEVKWRPWQLESRNPTNRSEEPIAPKAERTSQVETIIPQPERTQPRPSRGALLHNLRGACWTSHTERSPSSAKTDELHTTTRENRSPQKYRVDQDHNYRVVPFQN